MRFDTVLGSSQPTFLLASPDAGLLRALEPALAAGGARVVVALSAEATLAALAGPNPPGMALLDATLPGMETERLLAALRTGPEGERFALVLIADTVTQEWIDRLAEGVIDDLLPRTIEPAFVRPRLEAAARAHRLAAELDLAREAAALHAQTDRLTGVWNREAMLSTLFRETDRVQRTSSPLSLILFDIDDFGHWNGRLGTRACDHLLCQVAERSNRLLRSYDVMGRVGGDEFLVVTPGCANANATMLAERLRQEAFCVPFRLEDGAIRLSACFGIASSHGRSPVVVLREAEEALKRAKAAGPESIHCFGEVTQPAAPPVTFLSASSGDKLLAW